MKYFSFALLSILLLANEAAFSEEQKLTAEQQQYLEWAKNLWDSMDRKQGEITLLDGVATLNVPEGFYYLNPADTKKVLVDVWGNPPESSSGTLGMLFPADSTPFDQGSWGAIIEYEEDGYVSDEDADQIDYGELLAQMQDSTQAASKERVNQGYEPIELVGWASEPFYDKESHKLHWAKEVKFGNQPDENTLNYNIRVLGRKGVLVLNFVAGMSQKPVIDQKIDSVLAMAEFDQGSRYEDFNPDLDEVAAYGIGALVAGKVAAKAGLFAAALLFLKKFGIIVFAAVAAFFGKIFKRNKTNAAT
jgi:uncharacterized membrane-anchored protein